MTAIFIFLHTVVCVALACIILMQSGRGGGLTESFAAAESMFGAQTSSFLIKATTILSSIFLITCLSLAAFSSRKNVSLMSNVPAPSSTAQLPLTDGAKGSPSNVPAGNIKTSPAENLQGSEAFEEAGERIVEETPKVNPIQVPDEIPISEALGE